LRIFFGAVVGGEEESENGGKKENGEDDHPVEPKEAWCACGSGKPFKLCHGSGTSPAAKTLARCLTGYQLSVTN